MCGVFYVAWLGVRHDIFRRLGYCDDHCPAYLAATGCNTGGTDIDSIAGGGLTGGFIFHEGMLIGFGMLGRAQLAFVVIVIAYIQNSILSTEAFYMLMFTTFWLNFSVPVPLTLWKPYYDRVLGAET